MSILSGWDSQLSYATNSHASAVPLLCCRSLWHNYRLSLAQDTAIVHVSNINDRNYSDILLVTEVYDYLGVVFSADPGPNPAPHVVNRGFAFDVLFSQAMLYEVS